MSLPVFLMLLLLTCAYALARGGAPERIGSALLIAAFVAGIPVHMALGPHGYASVMVGATAIDVLLLVALIVLADRSTRYWPLWMAGWQLAAVIAHVAKMLDPTMQATGYAVQAQIWSYPMVLALAAGTWRHRTRLRAGDPDPAWKTVRA